ncbi:hypothetical protein Neosp_015177 [[Neocosmospora] mangrovei]
MEKLEDESDKELSREKTLNSKAAKEVHDKALRALADLEGLTEEKKKWSAAVDNDEISLPDMDYSDDSELDSA